MSKPSDLKPLFLDQLEAARDMLAHAAQFSSSADASLVKLAAQGFTYARRWTSDTTVTNQSNTARTARALETAAYHLPQTRLALALSAYGRALSLFAACEYRGASVNAEMTKTILAG